MTKKRKENEDMYETAEMIVFNMKQEDVIATSNPLTNESSVTDDFIPELDISGSMK